MHDTRLDLIASGASTPLFSNDNWGGGANLANAWAGMGAFALPAASRDAAVEASLPITALGSFTVRVACTAAIVPGVALVEVYDLDP